jgi:hypothetical protein
MSMLLDGAVIATTTYETALIPQPNLMLGCTSIASDAMVRSSFGNGYMNHEFIAAGANATITNIKAFQRQHALNYVASYSA